MGSSEVVRIPQHSHCVICGRAMPFGEKTESPECAARLAVLHKKRRNMMWLMYGSMAVAVGFLLWSLSRGA